MEVEVVTAGVAAKVLWRDCQGGCEKDERRAGEASPAGRQPRSGPPGSQLYVNKMSYGVLKEYPTLGAMELHRRWGALCSDD